MSDGTYKTFTYGNPRVSGRDRITLYVPTAVSVLLFAILWQKTSIAWYGLVILVVASIYARGVISVVITGRYLKRLRTEWLVSNYDVENVTVRDDGGFWLNSPNHPHAVSLHSRKLEEGAQMLPCISGRFIQKDGEETAEFDSDQPPPHR